MSRLRLSRRPIIGTLLLFAPFTPSWADEPARSPNLPVVETVERLVDLLESLQKDPERLQAVREALSRQAAELQRQIERSQPDTEQLEAKRREIDQISAQIAEHAQKLESAKADLARIQAEFEKMNAELEEVRRKQAESRQQLAAVERSLALINALNTPSAVEPPDAPKPPAAPIVSPAAPVAAAATPSERGGETGFTDLQVAFFQKNVLGVLAENCFGCHGPEKQESGMRLDSLAGVLKGGQRGPAIVPGDVEASRLVQAIRRVGELKMPPKKELDPTEVNILTEWVRLGAPWPGETVAPPTPSTPTPAAPVLADTRVTANFSALSKKTVDFNRDVRPILSDHCYACHGPDEKVRKAGLRFDDGRGGYLPLPSGKVAIVPGNLDASELVYRITAEDLSERMPPKEHDKPLTQKQIDTLKQWIREGAEWQKHWSFIPPKRPPLPEVALKDWPKNPIDYFILERLEEEGLKPAPEADKRTLIRRVTLDLTGLPPTPREVRDFVNDDSPDAYEKVVDRLLASPHYGEHMARMWLDLARYADTNGYHIDNERYMWRWRDWVIEAFNRNQPFDEFTVEQLAGDLLPNPSLSQLMATGFNRNHMINFEGGAIPEEYRVQYVIDRLDTTSTVWMGLTVSCAQCHDHKFDPISQREFYQMFAFFNSVPEEGLDGRNGNAKPFVKAPLPEQRERLAELEAEVERVRAIMAEPRPELDARQAEWEAAWRERISRRWRVLDAVEFTSRGGATLAKLEDGSILASGVNPDQDVYEIVARIPEAGVTAIRLEALTHESFAKNGASRAESGNFVLTEVEGEIASVNNPTMPIPVEFDSAIADYSQKDFPAANLVDGDPKTGWAVDGDKRPEDRTAVLLLKRPVGSEDGSMIRLRLRHDSQYPGRAIGRFRLAVTTDSSLAPSTFGPWHVNGPFRAADGNTAYTTDFGPETGIRLDETYPDGRLKWVRPRPELEDGKVIELPGDIAATYLYRKIAAPTTRTLDLAIGSNDAVKIWLNGEVVHDNNVPRSLTPGEDKVRLNLCAGDNDLLVKVVNYGNVYAFHFAKTGEQPGEIPLEIELVLAKDAEKRSEAESRRLRSYFRSENSPDWRALEVEMARLEQEKRDFEASIPTVMVMGEMEEPRPTHILMRGQYDQPGEQVKAATPDFLPPLPDGLPENRLGFARWLVHPEHPLTARVAVNRFWQRYFGNGIVKTSEDFGVQGEWPSHPELLDWLAVEFIESGWDVKALQRLIVTSAAYRQSSRLTPELFDRDPQNRLLARGPRFRLDAEAVRDGALAVSGLLVDTIGGPSVKPYQPPGIWEEVAYGANFTAQRFERDSGEALYRRSMYTFWKRQAPPPTMMLFDAPNREVCTARRARTNTPLQALALLNDVQFVEAARAFAERVLKEAGPDARQRLDYAFELATARAPSDREAGILLGICREQLERFRDDGGAAQALLEVGEKPRDEALDPAELAAWTTVASMILNLDETVTKN